MTDSSEKLVVIVPCFNEERNVEGTAASILEVAPTLPLEVDVLWIDDGSTDRTGAEIDRLCAKHGWRAVHNERNLGVGRSLLQVYATIPDGTWVTIVPGDNEVDFASIAGFVELRDRYDVILGYLKNPVIRPFRRRIFSAGYVRLVRMLYGLPYRYLNGMKLFRVDAFKGIEVHAAGHAFNSELIAKAILRNPNLRIGEAPYVGTGRATGESKAVRPRAVLQAVLEVRKGLRLVSDYRQEIIRARKPD